MTSHDVMMTNKLYLDDRNNDYIVLCKLGSYTISGCRFTGVGPPEPPPPPVLGSKKKLGLNRVNIMPANLKGKPPGTIFRREFINTGSSRSFYFSLTDNSVNPSQFLPFLLLSSLQQIDKRFIKQLCRNFFLLKDIRQFHA